MAALLVVGPAVAAGLPAEPLPAVARTVDLAPLLPSMPDLGLPLPAELVPPGCERLAVVGVEPVGSGWTSARLAGDTPAAGSGVLVWLEPGMSHLNGFLQGDDGRRWRVISQPDGSSRLELVDADRLPGCADAVRPDAELLRQLQQREVDAGWTDGGHAAGDRVAGARPKSTCDAEGPIDVLVLYTRAARLEAGSEAAVQGQIAAAVAASNAAYVNSAIQARVNLLMQVETDYESGSFGEDLSRLASPSDGALDWAHALRDTIGADMVALIRTNGDACGIAYLMFSNGPESQGIPFSVTALSCLANQTFAHELGHNMGCCHAVGDGGGCGSGGIYQHSVGWRFNGNSGTQWRTVMAYSPGNRLDHFSNPAVLFDGRPTGVPIGQPQQADNASTINTTWRTIAGFRCSKGPVSLADCNANGQVDALDVAFGLGSDCDGDGALDGCTIDPAAPCATAAALATCPSGLVTSVLNPTPVASDQFGRSVACNGTVGVVGVSGADDQGSAAGRAVVMRRTGDTWLQEAVLLAPDGAAGAQFGVTVAVADELVLVAAPYAKRAGSPVGRVYVFKQVGGTWNCIQTIECPAGTYGDVFGSAIAHDRGTLVVGARGSRPGGLVGAGQVFVFQRQGDLFVERQNLLAAVPAAGAGFGYALDLLGDELVVGSPYETRSSFENGVAYVFQRQGGQWVPQQELAGSSIYARFGCAVGLQADRLAIGSFGDSGLTGAVFTYVRAGDWVASQTLRPSGSRSRFGNALAVSGDRMLVGTKLDGSARGNATLYLWSGFGWERQSVSYLGGAVDITGDFAVVGDSLDDAGATDAGSAAFVMWPGDCDGDGLPDRCNVDLGTGADRNYDGILDSCQGVPGDLDGDGEVNAGDIAALLLLFGECPGYCPADLDGDGEVSAGDIAALLLLFG